MANGMIKYYELQQWWDTALSEEDRRYLEDKLIVVGLESDEQDGDEVVEIIGETATAANYLAGMLGALSGSDQDLRIREAFREKVRELIADLPPGLARHFALHSLIKDFYRQRDSNPEALEDTLWACREQIAIEEEVRKVFRSRGFVPSHTGFERMAIMLEKDGRIQEALDVSRQARAGGWAGTWKKRIDRLELRLAKLKDRGKTC